MPSGYLPDEAGSTWKAAIPQRRGRASRRRATGECPPTTANENVPASGNVASGRERRPAAETPGNGEAMVLVLLSTDAWRV
jgi:hypothetical protein